MLSAVPDLAPVVARVQVLGRVAVHYRGGESNRLTGSGQRLLAVLVAAGPNGASAERIADEIWGDAQPNPWRPALRMAIARLRKQLPEQWDVVAEGGSYRITTSDGWVDAWRLEKVASAASPIGEEDLAWLLVGEPFGDVDSFRIVAENSRHLSLLQVAVAERFCTQPTQEVSTATCALLASLVREHPFNDRLALAIAEKMAASDRVTEAHLTLSAFAETYEEEMGALSPDVARFLEGGAVEKSTATPPQLAPSQSPAEAGIAKELRHLIETPLLGRTDALEQLKASRGAIVTGEDGSGKSRLLAELVATDSQTNTTYVVGDDRLDLPLGPFAMAMPDLRDELLASESAVFGGSDGSFDRARSTRAWRLVLAYLEERSAVHPGRLIVDDAHLLDGVSLNVLRLLVRSNTTADLTLIVCGGAESDDAGWTDLVRDAERAGLDRIEIKGLTQADIESMVALKFPQATFQARQGLAVDVFDASDGLPAVAAPLIATADPDTLALPEEIAGASALTRVTTTFAESSIEVIAAAAVLGREFSIGGLIALTRLDESSVFRVLDELWSNAMIVETNDPDRVRFRHVLIQQAFADSIPIFRRGQLHRLAAELTQDPHARADHHASASSVVPASVAAESLLASARVYADNRRWRKVARELRRAHDLSGVELDASALTLWAGALDRSGSDGSEWRQAAYDLAVESADWDAALAAALSGLPEAEQPDGDRDRIRLLAGIPLGELAHGKQFDLLFNLSRQYSLIGDFDECVRFADQSLLVAEGPDEEALSQVLRWIATRHEASNSSSIPDDLGDGGSELTLARVAQMRTLRAAEQGDFAASQGYATQFAEFAIRSGDPLRIWHARGMREMFLLNNGEFEAANELAFENMQFAAVQDLQQGVAAYFGHRLFSFRIQGRVAELGGTLEPLRANLSTIAVGRAALLIVSHAGGETDIGDELRQLVSEDQARNGGTFASLSQIFLSQFMLEYTPDLVPATKQMLERLGDKPIVAGYGFASLGPTTRYVAQLTADRSEKIALLDRSVQAADRHGALLWRVQTRLDRAWLGSQSALQEAKQLSAGTELAAVVERRTSQLE